MIMIDGNKDFQVLLKVEYAKVWNGSLEAAAFL